MRVNSDQNSQCRPRRFFNNRLASNPGVAIVMLTIFLVASSFTKHPGRDLRAKQVNLIIRQIGHQLLLQSGDLISRVLPVTEIAEGTFQLKFENQLFFNHDSLVALSQHLLPKTQFPSGYTVTVHEAVNGEIVYGFQLNNGVKDLIACEGRNQPPGNYMIEIVFPDLYKIDEPKKDISQKKSGVDLSKSEPIRSDVPEMNLKAFELKAPTFRSEPLVVTPPNQSYLVANLIVSGMLIVLGVTLFVGRFRKSSKPQLKEQSEEFPGLGKFLFDAKAQRLLLNGEVISLTDKECRILELLNKNFGELILRETLMQKVWLDEGVITGRSLDVFVSKLRKKLCGDPALRITNVHGRGYKLEICLD